MDLSSLSLTELRRLKTRVDAEIERRADTTRRDLIKKVQKMATDAGVSLEDLIESSSGTKKATGAKRGRKPKAAAIAAAPSRRKKKVAPQFQNPEDASQQWTGRGRKPLWVAQWIEEGKSLDELRIQ